MKYYDDFLILGVFTKDQANQIIGNSNAAKIYLRNALSEGLIEKVRHNYYVVKSLETKQAIPSRFAIGSQINSTAFISHHSAFEYYGMANQVFNEVLVSSENRFKPFSFDGIDYRHIPTKLTFGIENPSTLVRVTDIERTILDSLRDFGKVGGLEELLRCLAMVTVIDEAKFLAYLEEYKNQFLYQKAGYILNFFPAMKLTNKFFNTCKDKIGKSRRYLYEGIKEESPKYISEWQLYAPQNLLMRVEEGGDILV